MTCLHHGLAAFTLTGLLAASAHGGYVMNLTSDGATSKTVLAGGSFTLDVMLASSDGALHNSAIFRTVFSEAGLLYETYAWGQPYETGGFFDDSSPFGGSLPVLLDASVLAGVGYPDGVVDVELSNVVFDGVFTTGVLASLTFQIPKDWAGSDQIVISLEPDTIANGFSIVSTTVANDFVLTIVVPTPAAAWGLLLIGAGRGRRRRV